MKIKEIGKFDQDVLKLYEEAGLTNYTDKPDRLEKGFNNSLMAMGAYLENELIGLIRAVGDGHTILLIQDIIVKPEYRRRGIGSNLLVSMIHEFDGVCQIHLVTDSGEKLRRFYESLDFMDFKDMKLKGYTIINI